MQPKGLKDPLLSINGSKKLPSPDTVTNMLAVIEKATAQLHSCIDNLLINRDHNIETH